MANGFSDLALEQMVLFKICIIVRLPMMIKLRPVEELMMKLSMLSNCRWMSARKWLHKVRLIIHHPAAFWELAGFWQTGLRNDLYVLCKRDL